MWVKVVKFLRKFQMLLESVQRFLEVNQDGVIFSIPLLFQKQLEVFTINDKYYSVLKTIGRGGSSKV